ncbi:3D domain-containing protein [Lactococcus allomyrinae]|uniref:Aspartate protease n=1 Tax=Lactococcus allomyrinae TaxID=2419773 RepID=A0A387BIY0_9LACT|nr:3D domain-containing protein [Lactococcus allomyrinae]AYG00987.1 aspartate protease [Lactococcus allomyrinae]
MKKLISKKVKQVGVFAGVLLMVSSGLPVGADSTQNEVNQQIQTFQTQLNAELTQVNDLYSKAQSSQQKVQQTQGKIDDLQSGIAQTQDDVASLKEVIAHQMRAMQSNGGMTMSVIDVIASSKNLSDMVMRLTSLNAVMTAESNQAKALVEKENTLRSMKTSLEATQVKLVQDQKNYQEQVTDLQGDISTLKDKIASNQKLLSTMQAKAAAEQKAHDEALAKSIAEAQQAQTQTSVSSSSTNNTSNSGSNSNPPKPVIPPTSSGRTINVQATAYALNGITAMGIDLSKNPMCIAVDPSVIPLGSMVEVPGYGVAIAGDTGGAIVGNIIDVHFPTNAQAIAWGRQNLQITVLS